MGNDVNGIGCADINIKEMTAGTAGSWVITYEAGKYGIDDGGELLIARRRVSDSDIPQFEDSNSPGYVEVYGDYNAKLKTDYMPDRYVRPWKGCISIKVYDGSIKDGDRIYIRYGSLPGEGCGYRIQTFTEKEHIFKIFVDSTGSGVLYEIEKSPVIRIKGGYANRLEAVIPSVVERGKKFCVLARALDFWGNIAEKYYGEIKIDLNGKEVLLKVEKGIGTLEGCSIDTQGVFSFKLTDASNDLAGFSNTVKCIENVSERLYWGDMHGQTKETVGTGTLDEYFSFARDKAAMDFCAWQGNDFQVTDETWENVNKKTREYHCPGKFITFPGYEWSGNTPAGGDHNIYYLNEGQPIFRSSGWQIGLGTGSQTDRCPVSKLFNEFKGRDDVIAIPHVGGRYGNHDYHSDDLIKLVEIHSHHGTFEWMLKDAIKKGFKVGVVSGSDDHTCRPGLSFPTRSTSRIGTSFDVKGGYAAVYSKELTRESLWDALKNRHCYATTGERILLDFRCENHMMGDEFDIDGLPEFVINVGATGCINDILIFRGLELIYSHRDSQPENEDVIRLEWSGLRLKGRRRKLDWSGRIIVENGIIKNFNEYAFDQPDEGVTKFSNQILEIKSKTSGDIDAVEFEIDYDSNTKILFCTKAMNFVFNVADLKNNKVIRKGNGVDQYVKAVFIKREYSKEATVKFTDNDIKPGLNIYWVKVVQRNGHTAWSSPMFVNRKQ